MILQHLTIPFFRFTQHFKKKYIIRNPIEGSVSLFKHYLGVLREFSHFDCILFAARSLARNFFMYVLVLNVFKTIVLCNLYMECWIGCSNIIAKKSMYPHCKCQIEKYTRVKTSMENRSKKIKTILHLKTSSAKVESVRLPTLSMLLLLRSLNESHDATACIQLL